MYWFWIHTVLSVILAISLIPVAANGFSIYRHKLMMSYRSLPQLMGRHIKLGYLCVALFILSLVSGEFVRSWSGWYVAIHKMVPVFLIPLLLLGIYSGFELKKSTSRRPLLHVLIFGLASVMTFLQLLTGIIMLSLVWSS